MGLTFIFPLFERQIHMQYKRWKTLFSIILKNAKENINVGLSNMLVNPAQLFFQKMRNPLHFTFSNDIIQTIYNLDLLNSSSLLVSVEWGFPTLFVGDFQNLTKAARSPLFSF